VGVKSTYKLTPFRNQHALLTRRMDGLGLLEIGSRLGTAQFPVRGLHLRAVADRSEARVPGKHAGDEHLTDQQSQQRGSEGESAAKQGVASEEAALRGERLRGRRLQYRPGLRHLGPEKSVNQPVEIGWRTIRFARAYERWLERTHRFGTTPRAVKRSAKRCRARLKRICTAVAVIAKTLAISFAL
jgi:hypothetical protein